MTMYQACEIKGCAEWHRYPESERTPCSICGKTVCGYHAGVKVNGVAECSVCIVASFQGRALTKSARIPARTTRKLRTSRKRARSCKKNQVYFDYLDAFETRAELLFASGGDHLSNSTRNLWFWIGFRDSIARKKVPARGTADYDCWCAGMDSAIAQQEKAVSGWARGETGPEAPVSALSHGQEARRA